jgi:hypothetical protein
MSSKKQTKATPAPTPVPEVKAVEKVKVVKPKTKAVEPVPEVKAVEPTPEVKPTKSKAKPKTKAAEPVPEVKPVETKAKVTKPKAKVAEVKPAEPTPEVKPTKVAKVAKPKAAKSPKEVKPKEEKPKEEEANTNGKRYFKYIKGDETPKGKYLAKKPKQAAVKAFSTISKQIRKSATDNSFVGVEHKFYVAEYKGKGKISKLIPYTGTIQLLDTPIEVPIRDKNKQPIMVAGPDGTMVQKKIVYKYDNRVVRDKTQAKIIVPVTETEPVAQKEEVKEVKKVKATKPRTKKPQPATETVTESSAHTLAA